MKNHTPAFINVFRFIVLFFDFGILNILSARGHTHLFTNRCAKLHKSSIKNKFMAKSNFDKESIENKC